MQIIPAIIPMSFTELDKFLEKIEGATNCVHIDLFDGTFGDQSWRGEPGDTSKLPILNINDRKDFMFTRDIDFEIHFMVDNPTPLVYDWIEAGATRVIIHLETLNYKNDIQFLDKIKAEGMVEIGIAINADTEADDLIPFLEVADFVQVMTIPKEGFQGASFDNRGIENIKWVKQNHPHMIVSVDGAMNPDTIEIVRDAGADRAIVGSYIFKSQNPREAIAELQSLI